MPNGGLFGYGILGGGMGQMPIVERLTNTFRSNMDAFNSMRQTMIANRRANIDDLIDMRKEGFGSLIRPRTEEEREAGAPTTTPATAVPRPGQRIAGLINIFG